MPAHYIFHIAKWYPNIDDDLEGIFIQRHIEATHPHYNSVVFYARATSKELNGHFFRTKEYKTDANYTYCGYYKQKITGLSIIDKVIKSILYFYTMHQLIHKAIKIIDKPLVLHAHVLLRPALLAWWFSLKLKVPYVISEHATHYTNSLNIPNWSLKNQLRRYVVKKANAIITVSRDLERGMRKFSLDNANYFRIFNCVDTSQFKPVTNEKTKAFNMLHVSEFKNEHKNILGLLEVILQLRKNNFKFTFHLVGYGQDLDEILKFIENNKLEDCVSFHGKLKDKQLVSLYSTSDVFILFSNKENMPCVIAESLCCGTPVISTDVGGISEVINKQNGILIERANQGQLYDALVVLIQNKIGFDSREISENAIQLFSFESVGKSLSKVYRFATGTDIVNR